MDLKLIKSKDIQKLTAEIHNLKNDYSKLKEEWLNSEETQKMLKISSRTLLRYRVSGKLKFSKHGRFIRFKKSDVLDFINNNFVSQNEEII